DKLKFELKLFSNVQQMPGQMNNAIIQGGGGGGIISTLLFGSGGAGDSGALPSSMGILDTIVGLFQRPGGVEGPVMEGGEFISGGGGGSSIFGLLSKTVSFV